MVPRQREWQQRACLRPGACLLGKRMAPRSSRSSPWPIHARRHQGQHHPGRPDPDGAPEGALEMLMKARKQMSDRDESLMGGKGNVRGAMNGGFEMSAGKYRGTGGDLRISVDPGLDIPALQHTLAEARAR